MQIPVNGSTSRDIKEKWSIFRNEPHNVRLVMETNGVNPFQRLDPFTLCG